MYQVAENSQDNSIIQMERCPVTTKPTFQPIQTQGIVDIAQDHGWHLIDAQQARVRKVERESFQKHCVVLGNEKLSRQYDLPDASLRMRIVGANDGTSAQLLNLAWFRMVCANLLYDMADSLTSWRVIHRGKNVQANIETGLNYLLDSIPTKMQQIETMRGIELEEPERLDFREKAFRLRFPDKKKVMSNNTFNPRRRDDLGFDLWTVFNRFQERLIQGGSYYYDHNDDIRGYRKIRALSGINSQQKLNSQLWQLASNYIN